MKIDALVLSLITAGMVFSAPCGAAAFDFERSSLPLPLSAAPSVPQAPAPVKASPEACKPFLLSIVVGGVDETVNLARVCTPENIPIWTITVALRAGKTASVRISSDAYPAERAKLENHIKAMAAEGINQADADFIVMKTGQALRRAAAAAPQEKEKLLAEATEALKVQLAQ